LDDGQLDLVMLRPNVVAGWLGVAIDVATGNRNGLASLKQWSGREFEFELDKPMLSELDGDPIGETTSGRFGVDPGALLVRLPVPAKRLPGLRGPAGAESADGTAEAETEASDVVIDRG
jgi:diacylglycerol kinase (ATP)